jgi:ubiquinone/menaquinone biosynthesis C-methylase UbiE
MRWLISLWWRLIRFGFRLLYYEMAFTYDVVSKVVSLGAWRCWQRSAIKHLPADVKTGLLLEVAHGTGDLQIDLQDAGYQVIGYDLSPYMGKIARRKLQKGNYSADLAQGRAQTLPFPARAFPAVVTTFPTDFIFKSETLGEIHRVLAVNGTLIIVLGGVFTGAGVVQRFLEWLYRITGQRADLKGVEGVLAEVVEHFNQHGFDARAVSADCPRSRAQLIIARKIRLPNHG